MYDPAHPFGRKAVQLAVIDPVSCTGCGWCAMFCPMKCIDLRPDAIMRSVRMTASAAAAARSTAFTAL